MSPRSPWSAYEPTLDEPWDLARAWTLRRRAGFAATWAELERDLAGGPGPAVDRVLSGECRLEGVPPNFDATAGLLADAASAASDLRRLQAWWLYRMHASPDPLGERLTLMWHDHFATSNLKVDDVAAMRRQNETFRRLARGPFAELVREALRDPALLVWLDAPSNRKGHPNENLARELMELFTMGVGRYSESDVREAARALTGRTVVQGTVGFRAEDHDGGPETILGRTASYDPDALADHLLAQQAAADRLAWRLCATFLGEGVADARAVAGLADRLRRDGLHVGRGVATVLRSSLFFSAGNLHRRVADPVGFVVGSARALERFEPPPSTLLLAEWTARMGQEVFQPPNVGGWPGGRSWLSGRAAVARANFAAALVAGRLNADAAPPDLAGLAARRPGGSNPAEALRVHARVLTGRVPDPEALAAIEKAAAGSDGGTNRAVALLLAQPTSQLC